jgi:hypothetical protein
MNEGARSYRYYETDESKALAPKEKTEVSNMLIPLE